MSCLMLLVFERMKNFVMSFLISVSFFLLSIMHSFGSDPDSSQLKKTIANFVFNNFQDNKQPKFTRMTINNSPVLYVAYPIIPEENLEIYVPNKIYNAFFEIMRKNKQQSISAESALADWNIVFSSVSHDLDIRNFQLVHNIDRTLIIFFGVLQK